MALAFDSLFIQRKPPASEQYNWITQKYEAKPEQLDLLDAVADEAILPEDKTVTLLATENGAQLLVSGFGLYIGKKSERVVVKQGKSVCAQVPFQRLLRADLEKKPRGSTANISRKVPQPILNLAEV